MAPEIDDETRNLLRTVCIAGYVRAGYSGPCNARLERLVESGFLEIVNVRSAIKPGRLIRSYIPTEKALWWLRESESE
jgi:hypothetical protein